MFGWVCGMLLMERAKVREVLQRIYIVKARQKNRSSCLSLSEQIVTKLKKNLESVVVELHHFTHFITNYRLLFIVPYKSPFT